jgi:hypothetical protein
MTNTWIRTRVSGDAGAALLITFFVTTVLTAMAVTVSVISINNVGNAGRDRQASAALALSEGGVAQAVSHLKSGAALRALTCSPTCSTNPWGNQTSPQTVTVATGEQYQVWIETVRPLDPASFVPGIYRIHSTGTSAGNPGARTVRVTVEVEPFKYPLAVFADTVTPGGTGAILNESLFSTGCIFKRDKIHFNGSFDQVYKIPAAAHTSKVITEDQGSGSNCPASHNKNIHHSSKSVDGCSNDVKYRYDQDSLGEDASNLAGAAAGHNFETTPCYGLQAANPSGTPPLEAYPTTSLIKNDADLAEKFDFNLEGLTADQLELLKQAAIEQGFYFTNTVAIPPVLSSAASSAPYPNPILFYDLQGAAVGGTVDLNGFNNAYSRAWPLNASDAACTGRSLFIIVKNGNVKMNANTVLTASIFALGPNPYGEVSKLNGTGALIGTLYGREIDLTGTGDIKLDDCFVQNPPGQALDVTVTDFIEVDRDLFSPAPSPSP